jgi:glycerol-1-phosphate dehydrogenase [NAD(P)+]
VTGLDLAALRSRLAAAPDAGQLRPLGLDRVAAGPDALAELPALVAGWAGPVALLVDATVMWRGPTELKPYVVALLGDVRTVQVGPADGRAHADEPTLAAATDAVRGASGIVTVGSGTVADIGKAVGHALGLPHVVVQTAASVNGYADSQSVLLRDGVKRTVPTAWPAALVVDGGVLAAAPAALNRAGLGDLLSMFTAPADWYLAHAVGLDPAYSPTAVALGREHGAELLGLAGRLDAAESVVRLAEILAVSGISMGVADRTAPSSGMEHTVSHLLDMGGVGALHGAQVGVATVVAALTWRHVRDRIARDGLRPRFPTAAQMRPVVEGAFARLDPSGAMGRECWADYRRKLERWEPERVAAFADRWGEHERVLAGLLGDPAEIAAALRAAGAPARFADLDPPVDPELARWAVTHCHLMRDRFTVADLAYLLGAWTGDDVDAVLAAAAELGAGP